MDEEIGRAKATLDDLARWEGMMKLGLPLIAALAVTACSRPPEAQKTVAMAWVRYVCDDGRAVNALYPDSQVAQLQLGDATHLLRTARSASGARYVGDALQWWTKGDAATLASLKPGEDVASAPAVRCGAVSAPRPTG